MSHRKTLSNEEVGNMCCDVYGMGDSNDANSLKIRYPLMRSIAQSGRYIAKINDNHYRLHHNHDGNFLMKYVEGEPVYVPVKVVDGEKFDGHVVEIYYVPLSSQSSPLLQLSPSLQSSL